MIASGVFQAVRLQTGPPLICLCVFAPGCKRNSHYRNIGINNTNEANPSRAPIIHNEAVIGMISPFTKK
jgi:hypothetical protein